MKTIEKVIETTVINRDTVFNNFKVNKVAFSFFLKNLQFQYAQKVQINRVQLDGQLRDVVVTSRKR